MSVSDDEDAQKLRFFAKKSTYDVGATIPLRLHSRVAKGLALLTYEGEEVIGHQIISIEKGDNQLEIPVEHAHFPNFRVSVALIDGRMLRGASKRFNIRRELKVTITPSKEIYAPGEKGSVEVLVTDQLGNPVKAELSLALVNQALLDRFPDSTADILTFFQEGTSRFTEFSFVSTCDWAYTALSKRTQDGGQESIIAQNDFEQMLTINELELKLNPSNSVLSFNCLSAHESVFNNGRFQQLALPQLQVQQLEQLQQIPTNAGSYAYDLPSGADGLFDAGQVIVTNGGAAQLASGLQAGGGGLGGIVPGFEFAGRATSTATGAVRLATRFEGAGGGIVLDSLSRASSDEGAPGSNAATVWLAPITTGGDGKAKVELQLPDTAGHWTLTAKACTTDSLVGQGSSEIVTRKEFLVELRTPDLLQEGDVMNFIATVHNLTDYEGDADVTLQISGGPKPTKSPSRSTLRSRAAPNSCSTATRSRSPNPSTTS